MVMQPYTTSCHCGAIKLSFEAERWPGQYIVNLGCVDMFALETVVFDGKHLL